jgi:hypothetical protein
MDHQAEQRYRDNQLNDYLDNGTRLNTIADIERMEPEKVVEPSERKPGRWVGPVGGFQYWKEYTEVSCFSCDKNFVPESQNDREEGYFCDNCITRPGE